MALVTNKWALLALNLMFSLIFSATEPRLQRFIDSLFLLGSFYLLLSLILFVVKGRFFDGVVYGARRAASKLQVQKDYLEEWQEKPLPSERINLSFLHSVLFQGMMLFVLMIPLLVLFYFI